MIDTAVSTVLNNLCTPICFLINVALFCFIACSLMQPTAKAIFTQTDIFCEITQICRWIYDCSLTSTSVIFVFKNKTKHVSCTPTRKVNLCL